MHCVWGIEACSQFCVFSECSIKTMMSLFTSVLSCSESFLNRTFLVWELERFFIQHEVLISMDLDKAQD